MTYTHKYLFEAKFKDGSVLRESPDDRSQTTEGKNAFYDVLQRIADVKYFCLRDPQTNHSVAVDLDDGHFEVNEASPFTIQDPSVQFTTTPEYRLIYFRRVTQCRYGEGRPDSTSVEYHIGWQTTVAGKNHQYTIAIS